MRNKHFLGVNYTILFLFILVGCRPDKADKQVPAISEKPLIAAPAFNPDSAYYFISRQVKFGPRIPNTQPHKNCADFLYYQFENYGAKVAVQEFTEKAFDGRELDLKNIIISFDPEKTRRILLAAHWDTRPFADKDTINPRRPFDGANDGASGVGILLEIARVLSQNPPPQVGVDIILFDGEDYGEPEFEDRSGEVNTDKIWWCLGSQYWSKNRHMKNYSAYYGILLDMVGAKNAKFYKEGSSVQYAKKITEKVWRMAERSGYPDYFINANSPGITDDHIFINRDAQIPTINIVDYDPDRQDSYFPAYHHTHRDNMDIIDKRTLLAVGQTILNLIYNEFPA